LLGRRPTKVQARRGIKCDQERRPGSVSERLLLELAPFVPRDDNALSWQRRSGSATASVPAALPERLARQNPILEARAQRQATARGTSGQRALLERRAARLAASR